MKQIKIFALQLLAISSVYTIYYTGTDGQKLGTETFDSGDFSSEAGFNVGQDRTFTFYFKLGALSHSSTIQDVAGYLFWLENQDVTGIYVIYEYFAEDQNFLDIYTDGPYEPSGEEEMEMHTEQLTGTDAVEYWYQVFIVYDGQNGVIKFGFNSTALSTLTDDTEIIMEYDEASAETESYDSVGFFDDQDSEEILTGLTVSFDDFRVYESVLTSQELIAEVACTEAQYAAGVYYGQYCSYQPIDDDNEDDDNEEDEQDSSGVLIQISLLLLLISLIFQY